MPDEKTLVILDPALRGGFTALPNAVLAAPWLSPGAKVLYGLLLMYAWQNNECWPGQETLATAMGCHLNSLQKYLKELRAVGLISWKRQGLNKPNLYFIQRLEVVEALKTPDSQKSGVPDSQKSGVQDSHQAVKEEYTKNNHVVVVGDDPPEITRRSDPSVNGDPPSLTVKYDLITSVFPEVCREELDKMADILECRSEDEISEAVKAVVAYNKRKPLDNLLGILRDAIEQCWTSRTKNTTGSGKKKTRPSRDKSVRDRQKQRDLIRQLYFS